MLQTIYAAGNDYQCLDEWISQNGIRKILLACGGSIRRLVPLNRKLERLAEMRVPIIRFQDFQPNPLYESVVQGVMRFRAEKCDAIAAVGGGSAMDVAKCIRLYANLPGDGTDGGFLDCKAVQPPIPFLAVPTTAGTGSEATRYAVIYYRGKKQSISSAFCIPDAVVFDPGCLSTLPLYQRKATMMDAFCHAMESFWSVNSTEESRNDSRDALIRILENMDGYLNNTEDGNRNMLLAAHTAGKAINLAQTTAGHAMCYQITKLFGCAHGHAAALCDRVLFPWMVRNTSRCTDPRGEAHLVRVLDEIGQAMGCRDGETGAERFAELFRTLELDVPRATNEQYRVLTETVHPDRLKNHPISLDRETIDALYHHILRQ